ncbi:MAG: hypothetical protein U0573_11100 [Phycisphaerales bacterium]|nr:hypothetical protein [Planctomycetota bacterium]
MSIRGTILAKIDPHASELQPIGHPRIVALGLLLWPLAALVAAVGLWWLRVAELAGRNAGTWPPDLVVIATLLSGLGACVLIRPHAQIPIDGTVRAVVGVLLYLPLTLAFYVVLNRIDAGATPTPFSTGGSLNLERSGMRLLCDLLLMLIIGCLRPNARIFVHRSMLLRSGKVDRQTMLAMVGALAIIATGDLVHIAGAQLGGGSEQIAQVIGTVFVAVGSMFLTLGLIGTLVDCARIVPAVLSPPISLESIADGTPSQAYFGSSHSSVP